MCYSAKVQADYRKYVRAYGADVDLQEFYRILRLRVEGHKIALPKGLTDPFKELEAPTAAEAACRDLVLQYEAQLAPRLEEELFGQRRRLVDAQRKLAVKETKKAREDVRIATAKIAALVEKLDGLKDVGSVDGEDRIYPGYYCPVLTMTEDGRYLVSPMRYLCRPAGKPAFFDMKFPGTYNARRDNLGGFWKGQFAQTHGVILASAFFENVKRHRLEGRELEAGEGEENVVLRFAPADGRPMQLACLWSHWTGANEELRSFALVTDEPPGEVAAAGHDRCPIPLTDTNLRDWLAVPGTDAARCQQVLDDRHRPVYLHRLAA